MRSIKVSNLALLTNGKLLSFAKLVRIEGEASGDERLTSLINKLDAMAGVFTTAMMYAKTNAMTARIEKLDDSICQGFRALRKLSTLLPISTVESIAKAGESLSEVFEKYGDISKLPYEDKAAKMSLLLTDLESKDLSALASLGFSGLLGSLRADQEEFDQLYLERNSYRDTRKAKVDSARTDVEGVLRQIMDYAAVMSGFDENYGSYIGKMDEFFVWNIVSNKQESSDTVSDGQTADSSETAGVNEASKGEPSDEDMES